MDSRGMHDLQVENETSSDEFVLHLRLPSLQEMAYNQIAIALWYGYRSTPSQRDYEPRNHKSFDRLELMDCHKLIRTLAIPQFMKENLKNYLKRVREETISCTRFFKYELLSASLEEYRIPQVDWEYFVWCPDGRINYKSTAIKMLHSHVLTEVQKFVIMSSFCLENEIKIFDLNRLPMKTFIPKVKEDRDFLLFYWICYLKNELHRIWPFFNRPVDRHRIIIHLIYDQNRLGAFEFFWNHLNAEGHASFISDRLDRFELSHWYYSLFCKMSHDELSNLLFHQPAAVISAFIKGMEMPEWAIMTWNRCKNWISNEQFVQLLDSVLGRLNNNPIIHQEHKMSVLLEIWNTANDRQKNYAARQAQLEDAVHLILSVTNTFLYSFPRNDPRLWRKLAPSTFKFLLKFLSLTSANFRKNLILQGDPSFIFYFDFHLVHKIFELCLPNSQGEVRFENESSNYHEIRPYFCLILYTAEDLNELNRRLLRSFQTLNIPSKDTLEKFIESLIIANKREYPTSYTYDLIRMSKFITKILQENVSAVLKMKESYFSSFSVTSDPYERYGSLNELSKLIEQEFVYEHLQELKHRLAKILQTTCVPQWVWTVVNYEKFTCLFSWCFENEKYMFRRVKRCIPINDVIRDVFYRIALEMTSFDTLQRFLEWYFSGVEEEVISFKLGLMNDPVITEILEEFQQKHGMRRCGKFLQWIGHPDDRRAKRSTYGIVSFFFILFFAILSVIYVHL